MITTSRVGEIPGILKDGKLNYENIYQSIVEGMKEYLTTYNIECMIIGVSGGLDSAVSAAICKTVSHDTGIPLIGISLPCSTNKEDEIISANAALDEFCDKHFEVNLQDLFVQTEKVFNSCGVDSTPISQGNIKARLRGSFLRNLASIKGGIVIDTDNLTEHFLGFYTICGDVGDLSPIAGLWKTEVYGLAQWLRENVYKGSEALKMAIEIVPTDGNGVSVSDLDQIAPGLTYEAVDEVLIAWLGLHEIFQHQWMAGLEFEPQFVLSRLCEKYGSERVNMIIHRNINSEFKRKSLPRRIDCFTGKVED